MKIYIYCLIIIIFVLIFSYCFTINNLRPRFSQLQCINSTITKQSFLIFTIETRPLSIVSLHNQNINNYSKRHQYKYYFLNDYSNKLELPVYWWKLQKMKEYMDSTTQDWIMWMDSDTIICQLEYKLENLVSLFPNASIIIGKDNRLIFDIFCAGVFLIRNNKIGKKFILDCLNDYILNTNCKKNNVYKLEGVWAGECYEQGVMNKLLKTVYKDNIGILSSSYIFNGETSIFVHSSNIYDTFILHYYGSNKNKTYKMLYNGLEHIKKSSQI